ncbi:MAG: helix-turn-helix domain-containing protein [Methanomassiliicoccales archaeon]|nr:MAG: helix-turn-helix domain-containing protein [Methanomassiliicoccales archaeon]
MDELDMLLSVIENPTRRKILEALMREPHYPLQLSRELGLSQQGIMKHLKVLEDYDLVRSYSEESDQGGPSRKIYVPTTGFTITVDIGPGLFNTELVKRVLEMDDVNEKEMSSSDLKEFKDKLMQARGKIRDIDRELEALAERRARLIQEKEKSLNDAYNLIEALIDDYHERRVLYAYMQRPELDEKDLARTLGLRDEYVKDTLERYAGGVKDDRRGQRQER